MNFDERAAEPSVQDVQAPQVQSQLATAQRAGGNGYTQQAAALSPREPLIDPETGKQVGTYLDYDGVLKVFDRSGKIAWIDEIPIQSTVGPLDLLFGVRSIVAAAGMLVRGAAMEHKHKSTNGPQMMLDRIPSTVWAELRSSSR